MRLLFYRRIIIKKDKLHYFLYLISNLIILIYEKKKIYFCQIYFFLKNMVLKLNQILAFWLLSFFLSFFLYPLYIKILKKLKVWKTIRENSMTWEKSKIFSKLHKDKAWTPTMWWWLFLIIVFFMILISFIPKKIWITNFSLISRRETYILLFGLFSMWFIWLLDDFLNIKWHNKIKWLSANMKIIRMSLFATFISRRFYHKLWISTINFRPIAWNIDVWIFFPIITFFTTIFIVNSINITDWLDGLVWWLISLIFLSLAIVTFSYRLYLSTTLVVIFVAIIIAFLRFNIFPAKIFMWDSGAFAIWGFLSTLVFILNIKLWILIPFFIMFLFFIVELFSSWLQIFSKKFFHKKIFKIAPLHHLFEHKWKHETSIVMKSRLIQWILCVISIILIFYQFV